MKKLKWHGIIFALFILFLYIMGTYDIFMMLSHNEAYYISKGYGQIVHEYFTNYPIVGLVMWIGNLMCGLLAPVLYLFKNKNVYKVAYASFIFDLLLILLGAIFNNRFEVFETNIICFDMFILIITLLMVLATWGVDTKALVASLGVAGAVAGLAMQDMIKDFIGGADILTEDQFKVGDNIEINGFRGNVIYLGMKVTKIRAYTGEVRIIANRNINAVTNYSMMTAICVIDIGLSYDNKIEKAEEVLQRAIENAKKKVTYLKKITILGIEELKNDAIIFRIEAEVEPMKNFEFNRILLKEVLKEAEANNLTLSYNKVDVKNV